MIPLSSLILAALATTTTASSFVLGDFEVLNPFTSTLDAQPQVWFNAGDGVSPSSNIVALGRATGNAGTGLLCAGQNCPLGFYFGTCSGSLKSADGESAIVHATGPGFDVPNLYCGKNLGYTQGSVGDRGRFQSFYRCFLGPAVSCT